MKQMSNDDFNLVIRVLEHYTRGAPPTDLREFNLQRRAKQLYKRLIRINR